MKGVRIISKEPVIQSLKLSKFGKELRWNPLVQGLRTLAIVGVITFHFFPLSVPRGYLGVDIFFVISGYVITKKILTIKQNRGWIREFYKERYLRLAPSLFVTLVVAGAAKVLLTEGHQTLPEESLFGILFASNVYHFFHSNYFSESSNTQTFIHLWSLGVEVQFYLLFPWLLGIQKITKGRMRGGWVLLAILSAISLGIFLLSDQSFASFNFYSPISRFWEFAIGSFIALLAQARLARQDASKYLRIKKWAGYSVLILLCVVLLTPWYGLNNRQGIFLGCLLTASLIALNPTLGIMTNQVTQYIGLRSYEIYLAHWPIVSILIFQIDDTDFLGIGPKILLILFSGLLGAFFYNSANRIRKSFNFKKLIIIQGLMCTLLLGAIYNSGESSKHSGLSSLSVLTPVEGTDCVDLSDRSRISEFCRVIKEANSDQSLVIWGDSLAGAYSRAFLESKELKNYSIYRISVPACGPFPNLHRTDKSFGSEWCSSKNLQQEIFEYIMQLKPVTVAIVSRWDLYLRGLYLNGNLIERKFYTNRPGPATEETSIQSISVELNRIVTEFSGANIRVVVFGESPFLDEPAKFYLQSKTVPDSVIPKDYLEIRGIVIESIIGPLLNTSAALFNPYGVLCPEDRCTFLVNGLPAYQDNVHITEEMSRYVAENPLFNSVLKHDGLQKKSKT